MSETKKSLGIKDSATKDKLRTSHPFGKMLITFILFEKAFFAENDIEKINIVNKHNMNNNYHDILLY